MSSTNVAPADASGRPSHTHRRRGVLATGLAAVLTAMAATSLAAALARALR